LAGKLDFTLDGQEKAWFPRLDGGAGSHARTSLCANIRENTGKKCIPERKITRKSQKKPDFIGFPAPPALPKYQGKATQ
jgi:hypothetical protein